MHKRIILLVVAFIVADISFAQRVRIPIWVSDGANQQRLVVGVDPNGTDGIDDGLDQLAPPAPPIGNFDTRLRINDEDFLVDIRDNTGSEKRFTLLYTEASGEGPIVLTWDQDLLASLGTFEIVDNINGQLFGPLDMTSTSSLDVSTAGGLLDNGLRILVTPNIAANQPPSIQNDATTTPPDTDVIINVLSNDDDVDDDNLDPVFTFRNPSNGTITINADNTFTYSPDAGFLGTDNFEYVVNDDNGNTGEGDVEVRINQPPSAVDDNETTDEDTAVTINVLDNDTDPDGSLDPGSVAIVSQPSNGSVDIDGTTGDVTYTPDENFNSEDSFTYTVDDNDGATSNEATVMVSVNPVNDPPVFTSEPDTTVRENSAYTYDITVEDVDGDPISIAATVKPDWLNFNDNGDGTATLSGTPGPADVGDHPVELDASDGAGGADDQDFTITVVENLPPVAEDDSTGTDEETSVVIDVLVNDSDQDGTIDTSTISVTSGPSNGTANVNAADGTITYTPDVDFAGTDTLKYTVDDDEGATSNEAAVVITVLDINDPPVALADTSQTDEDVAVTVDVLANDSDVDGTPQPNTVTIVTQPSNGSVDVDAATGEITYTPDANYNGDDSFTYIVDDEDGATSNEATVSITVDPVNDDPEFTSTAITNARTNSPYEYDITVEDIDGDPISIVATVKPAWATFTDNGDGTAMLSGTPTDADEGDHPVELDASDGAGGTDNQDFTITVTPNLPPVAENDSTGTNEEVPVVVDVLANDSDADGTIDTSSVQIASPPTHGSASVDMTDGSITYTPEVDFAGTDTLTYTVTDNEGAVSNEAQVVIAVVDVNDPPVAATDSTETDEDTAIVVDVLTNDNDIDGALQPGTVVVVSAPSNGSTNVDGATGEITYTPDADFNGEETFTYSVEDDDGAVSNEATVHVTVNPVNDPPVAADDSTLTNEDTAVAIDVLANDEDIDGTLDPTSLTVVLAPSHGAAVVDAAEITYTPDPNYFGPDTLTYTVSDNDGAVSNEAHVIISVVDVNDPPVAEADSAETDEDVEVTVNVLANDSDVDGSLQVGSVSVVTPPSNGSTSVDAGTGEITYTPDLNFNGEDTFGYTVSDNDGDPSAEADVVVTVNPVNDAPAFSTDPVARARAGSQYTYNIETLDAEGDPVTITAPSLPAWLDEFTDNGDGTALLQGTPAEGDEGDHPVSLHAEDPSGAGTDQDFTVTVFINDAPVAVADSASTDEDTAIDVDVLANDFDPDGSLVPSSVDQAISPKHGTVSIDPATGVMTYQPDEDFSGTDQFGYTVEDDFGEASHAAPVTVFVREVNDPPLARADSATTDEDVAVLIALLSNDSDPDSEIDPSTVQITDEPSNGSVSIDPSTGDASYEPGDDFEGTDEFTYTVADDNGSVSNVATVWVNVIGVPDPPVARDDSASVDADTSIEILVLANDSDADGDDIALVHVQSSTEAGGTAEITDSGTILYTPPAEFSGTDEFTYRISSPDGDDEASVVVKVRGVVDIDVDASVSSHVVVVGSSLTYVAAISNNGVHDASDITVQTTLDEAVTVVSVNSTAGSCTYDVGSHAIHCVVASLASGASFDVSVVVTAPDESDVTFETFIEASAVENEDDETNNSESVIATTEFDGDGIPDSIEDGHPNKTADGEGDGNGDGIPDSRQLNVTSLPSLAADGAYVTIESPSGTSLRDVRAIENPSPDDVPDDVQFPFGFFAFEIEGIDVGGTSIARMHLPEDVTINSYWKYGATSAQPAPHWYDFSWNGSTGAQPEDTGIDLIYVDGSRGDDDLSANGAVLDPGGPALTANQDPTAVADTVSVDEDSSVTVNVVANDHDTDGDDLRLVSVSNPGYGSAEVLSDSLIRYEPQADFSGQDTIRYVVQDVYGAQATGEVIVFVREVNDAPSAPEIVSPADSSSLVIAGAPDTPLVVEWTPSEDVEGDDVAYIWQMAGSMEFQEDERLMEVNTGESTRLEATYGTIATLLTENGIELNSSVTVYHRVFSFDGSDSTSSPISTLSLTRGAITSTDAGDEIPTEFSLAQNYPNPFNPVTSIEYGLPETTHVTIRVYNSLGEEVATLVSTKKSAGRYVTTFDARRLASGVYVYRIQAGTFTAARTMVVLK